MVDTGEQAGGFVLLGKITKPHGIRGELKLFAYTEDPQSLTRYEQVYLSADDGMTYDVFHCDHVRAQTKQVIVRLRECNDRNRAEELVGCGVWVKSEELPRLEEGEFYLFELEGKQAVGASGEDIGVIESVLVGAGQDLLNIRKGKQKFLVPLVPEFLVRREGEKVVLDLPPGLLDING